MIPAPQQYQVACSLTFTVQQAATFLLGIAVARRPGRSVHERLTIERNGDLVDAAEIAGPDDDRRHFFAAQPGRLTVEYEATVTDGPAEPVLCGDWDRITALLPSRYCPTDRMTGFARSHFGALP